MRTQLITALALFTSVAGCVDPDVEDGIEIEEDVSLDETPLCSIITDTPPAPHYYWILSNGWEGSRHTIEAPYNYGDEPCDRVVIGFENALNIKLRPQPYHRALTETECENLTLTASWWVKRNNQWSYVTGRVDHGEYTQYGTCKYPEMQQDANMDNLNQEMRVSVRARFQIGDGPLYYFDNRGIRATGCSGPGGYCGADF